MTNMKFDDFVKKRFSDYSPDVPAHIWDTIADKRKKRRAGGFWFNRRNLLLLIVLIGAGGTAWWLSNKPPSPEGELFADSREIKESVTSAKSKTETAQNPSVNNSPNDNSAIKNTISDNNITAENITTNKPTIKQSDNKNLIDSKINSIPHTAQQALPGTSTVYSPLPYLPPASPVAAKRKKSARSVNRPKLNNEDAQIESSNEDGYDVASNKGIPALTGAGTLMGKLMYAAEKLKISKNKTIPGFTAEFHEALFPKCPRIDAPSGNEQYVDLYAGPDIAIPSFTDTGNSAYLQKRKESTKFSSAYSAGFRYTRVFNNSVSLRTGINYSQINEKFNFEKGGIIQYVYTIDQATGDTIGSYSITGTRYKTTFNRYRTIDVPLQIGYEMGNGRLHANLSAGAMINLYSWQRGDVLDTSLAPVNITSGKSSSPYGFKTNIGVGFIAGASFYYKLSTNTDAENAKLIDRMHLLFEPYFRYSFRPMSKENFTLTQKYSTAGFRLGIRIDIK